MLHPELNLDGLPGPTHGFSGLSFGNLASTSNRNAVSNPRAAFLQCLDKAALVASLGLPQGFLPPHPRPHLPLLRQLGFTGTDAQVIEKVWKDDPALLVAASSSSAMWTANAATICPSLDSLDGRLHLTAANLANQFHRSLEGDFTHRSLRAIFPDESRFAHHLPLPLHPALGDEGAANHVFLQSPNRTYQLFIHAPPPETPTRFPARQTRRASESVARLNQARSPIFLSQSVAAIDAGAFHNDVVSVGSADVLLMHEQAFTLPPAELQKLLPDIRLLVISTSDLTLQEAVETYLFNSQLIPVGDDLHLIAPTQVRDHPRARAAADRLLSAGTRLRHIHYVDLTQSMRNGGGPACLRLRIPLTQAELAAVHPGILLTPTLLASLRDIAHRHYRDALAPRDLADPHLLTECRDALDALGRALSLPDLYAFR